MNENTQIVIQELTEAHNLLEKVINDQSILLKIEDAAQLFATCLNQNGKILSCGNGGSHCDAMHFAEELSGRFRENRKPFAAMSISDVSHITCTANDFGFDHIFSRAIEALGQKNDVLLAISTSGNSENIINAVNKANELGMKTVLLTGKDGGKLKGKTNVEIIVPHFGYADRIQEIHIKIIHIFILLIERKLL